MLAVLFLLRRDYTLSGKDRAIGLEVPESFTGKSIRLYQYKRCFVLVQILDRIQPRSKSFPQIEFLIKSLIPYQ